LSSNPPAFDVVASHDADELDTSGLSLADGRRPFSSRLLRAASSDGSSML